MKIPVRLNCNKNIFMESTVIEEPALTMNIDKVKYIILQKIGRYYITEDVNEKEEINKWLEDFGIYPTLYDYRDLNLQNFIIE